MFLKMINMKEEAVENQITMEKVVDDLLMIEIKVNINKNK
ncbi:PTS system, mannitol-specific IIA component, putative, partial [Listeria seeligeri FSL S4-171]